MKLTNKVALVTGGSSGIGRATVLALGNEGCNVVFTYNSKKDEAEKVAAELRSKGVKTLPVKVDLHDEADVDALFEALTKEFATLDILVNNAGINRPRDLFGTSAWKEVFQVDLFSLVACTGKAVELMKDGGKVLNISSIYAEGKACPPGLAPYGAAKAAVSHFTQTLAKALAPKILVNAIAPGYVQTPLWKNTSPEEFEESGKEQLIERMIQPE